MKKAIFAVAAASLGLTACAEPVDESEVAEAEVIEEAEPVDEPAEPEDASDGEEEVLVPEGEDGDRGNPVDQEMMPGNVVDQ